MDLLHYELIPHFNRVIISGWSNNPYADISNLPDNTVSAYSVPIPTELNQIFTSWPDFLEAGASQLFTFHPSTELLSPVPIDLWYSWYPVTNADSLDNPNNIRFQQTGLGETSSYLGSRGYEVFQALHPTLQVQQPISWGDAELAGKAVLSGLLYYSQPYSITGTPMDPSIVSVYQVATNPQGTYETPEEAVQYLRLGPEGVALNLGLSWPPPMPE